jgi:hypothetical protein
MEQHGDRIGWNNIGAGWDGIWNIKESIETPNDNNKG